MHLDRNYTRGSRKDYVWSPSARMRGWDWTCDPSSVRHSGGQLQARYRLGSPLGAIICPASPMVTPRSHFAPSVVSYASSLRFPFLNRGHCHELSFQL